MGANDICSNCEKSLDFFHYYVVEVSQYEGPLKVDTESARVCGECGAHLLGLHRDQKYSEKV